MNQQKEDVFHLGVKALIRNNTGQILLLKVNLDKLTYKDKGAYWDIPGSRIQIGSTIEETLRREVEEETGITTITTFTKLDMILSNIRIPQGDHTLGLVLAIYICEVKDYSEIKISDEHVEAKWFDPAEAAELLKVKYPQEFCDKISEL